VAFRVCPFDKSGTHGQPLKRLSLDALARAQLEVGIEVGPQVIDVFDADAHTK
jgi:hypothetical protein